MPGFCDSVTRNTDGLQLNRVVDLKYFGRLLPWFMAPRGRGASSDSRPWTACSAGERQLRGSVSNSEDVFGTFLSPAP